MSALTNTDKIGERIKERRKQLDMTLKELGEASNVSASFICDIEKGKTKPSMTKVAEIAQALKVPLTYLLGEDDSQFNEKIINNIESNSTLYDTFLNQYRFPNGLTYVEMDEKIKKLETLEKLLKG